MTRLSSSLQPFQIGAGEACYAGINAVLGERVNRLIPIFEALFQTGRDCTCKLCMQISNFVSYLSRQQLVKGDVADDHDRYGNGIKSAHNT